MHKGLEVANSGVSEILRVTRERCKGKKLEGALESWVRARS